MGLEGLEPKYHSLMPFIQDILIPSFFQWSALQSFHYVTLHKLSVCTELLLVSLLFEACLQCHNVQTPYNGASFSVISFAVPVSQKCSFVSYFH